MKKKFHGVKLSELDELEKLYKVKIHVYSLALTQNHREDNEDNESDIAAILICRSHRHYALLKLVRKPFLVHQRSGALL